MIDEMRDAKIAAFSSRFADLFARECGSVDGIALSDLRKFAPLIRHLVEDRPFADVEHFDSILCLSLDPPLLITSYSDGRALVLTESPAPTHRTPSGTPVYLFGYPAQFAPFVDAALRALILTAIQQHGDDEAQDLFRALIVLAFQRSDS